MSIFYKIYYMLKYKRKFKKLGIKVYGIHRINVEYLEHIYIPVKQAFVEYPLLVNHFKWISFVSKNKQINDNGNENAEAYTGFWNSKTKYVLTRKGFGISYPYEFINKLPSYYDVNEWLTLPKISYLKFLTWHEIGHLIDWSITYDPIKLKPICSEDIYKIYYFRFASDEIFNELLMESEYRDIFKSEKLYELYGDSIYDDPNEIIAETVALKHMDKEINIKTVDVVYNKFINRLSKG